MSNETVLILDNEPHIRWALKALLEIEQYSIIAVDKIGMALDHFSKGEISSLITEYQIDQTSTLEMIRDLKMRFPEIYVMMLTRNDLQKEKYEEIIRAGVDDFFQKPFSSEKILFHLKKGLRQRDILLQKNRLEREMGQMRGKGISWGFYRRWKRHVQLESH